MATFTKEELFDIKENLKFADFEEIIFSEKYENHDIYVMHTKIPLEDWELEVAYFSKENAEEMVEMVEESSDNPGLPVNAEVNALSLSTLKTLTSKDDILWQLSLKI